MATKAELLRAELEVAELEERLIAAKKKGNAPRKLKEELRETRRAFREMREAPDVDNG